MAKRINGFARTPFDRLRTGFETSHFVLLLRDAGLLAEDAKLSNVRILR